jgi:hypothetical protein
MKGAVEMANEEICPFCGGEIVNGAIVCRGCGANKGPGGDKDHLGRYLFVGLLFSLPALILAVDAKQYWAVIFPYVCFYMAFKEWKKRKTIVWHRRMA